MGRCLIGCSQQALCQVPLNTLHAGPLAKAYTHVSEQCGTQLNFFVTKKIKQCWLLAGKSSPTTLICTCCIKGCFPEITAVFGQQLISCNVLGTHHPLLISIKLSNLSLAEAEVQPAPLVYSTAVTQKTLEQVTDSMGSNWQGAPQHRWMYHKKHTEAHRRWCNIAKAKTLLCIAFVYLHSTAQKRHHAQQTGVCRMNSAL